MEAAAGCGRTSSFFHVMLRTCPKPIQAADIHTTIPCLVSDISEPGFFAKMQMQIPHFQSGAPPKVIGMGFREGLRFWGIALCQDRGEACCAITDKSMMSFI
ncbi:MAG: hypothetical protein K0R57_3250 [Paenibacillaceae bacterium]|nr:hypothetical protein [Paenibacillaceae bacterium]